jgi:REP element-mobilizing transposase RayT
MRRRPREDSLWHVFTRGSRRMALFYEDQDYREFLLFVKEALIVSGCLLYGYCLMANHYHLILRGSQAQLSECMWRLNHRYALYHNDRHRMGGHVFEGPYNAFPQRGLRRLLWKLAYVFLNPVSAGLVDLPGQFPWSGYLSFMGQRGSPLEVDPFPWMADLGPDLERARAWFQHVVDEQRVNGQKSSGAAPTAAQVLSDQFSWLVRQANQRAKGLLGVDATTLALFWGQESGIPPRVMVRFFSGLTADALRKRVHRFKKALEADETLARLLEL